MQKDRIHIRFLYRTVCGRIILRLLVCPWVSKTANIYLDSVLSHWMIGVYVRKYNIDLSTYKKQKYRSFNDFFTRERENNIPDTDGIVCPCDAYLSAYRIDEDSVYNIKNVEYKLEQLLDDGELAHKYAGGTCLIFRLTPSHYHRYCYACSGETKLSRRIEGKLHCVRPLAYTTLPVFIQNSREYTVIESRELGTVVQMEVGALLVGKINNKAGDTAVSCGAEKGYFEFGGSTVIVLLEKDALKIDSELFVLSEKGVETDVVMGTKLGEIIHLAEA